MNGCGLCSRSFDVQNRRGVWLAMQISHESPSLGMVTGQADDECQFKAGPSCSLLTESCLASAVLEKAQPTQRTTAALLLLHRKHLVYS